MAETVANKNRRVRQEQLREQLEKGGHVQHVVDIAKQLMEPESTLEPTDITRLKAAADIKLKLIDKYIPGLKQTEMEITGRDGDPLDNIFTVNIVKSESK